MDERLDRLVDQLCMRVPIRLRWLKVHLARRGALWHLLLALVTMKNAVSGALSNVRSEDDMELFLRETSDAIESGGYRVLERWQNRLAIVLALDDAGETARFFSMLFLMGLSAFLLVLHPGRELGVLSAALALDWAASAAALPYRPLLGKIRQAHLCSRILRGMAAFLRLAVWFALYAAWGVASNVILQSTMLVLLFVHLSLYLAVICFNPRQNLFLRILDGLLGVLPALCAAAALALLAAAGSGSHAVAAGLMRAMGALLLFAADRVESLVRLGDSGFRYARLVIFLLSVGGSALLLSAGSFAAF